ncbi:MAG: NAD-dependent epimerase/dehydratase family protein [Chitinophagales bacterium]|nr:NAD-dependent epimerase/dehydratase family protein [Chitinophagales bacterium]
MKKQNILVTGANGQIGSDLIPELKKIYGDSHVIATDISEKPNAETPFEVLDVLDAKAINSVFKKYQITQVYHLASLLSAKSELNPRHAWNVNINGLFNIMDNCVENKISKLFWPSSIAVFGPNSPKIDTPQFTTMDPDTVYGISKLAGERWCHHYHFSKSLDVRSLRYPGVISYKHEPGGGTTDYAVDIYFKAVQEGRYECYLTEDTILPMMYIPDAIKATIQLMESPSHSLGLRSGYNIAGMSFAPEDLAKEILNYIPDFKVIYRPDFRQRLADTWPESVNDQFAKADWNWQPEYDIKSMTEDMIKNVRMLTPV